MLGGQWSSPSMSHVPWSLLCLHLSLMLTAPPPLCFQRYFQHGKFYLKGIFPPSFLFCLWMRSQGAIKCGVSHLAEPEETMLTRSLIYPIAAVTGVSFGRWTKKLEWMRWTLAWEKSGLVLPPLP